VAATAEEESAAKRVIAFVGDVGVHNQVFKLGTIGMELLLVKLILQEFRDDFGFVYPAQSLHAASSFK
jgi:hypothetical protein